MLCNYKIILSLPFYSPYNGQLNWIFKFEVHMFFKSPEAVYFSFLKQLANVYHYHTEILQFL